MPAPIKLTENIKGHRTIAEIEARQKFEAEISRKKVRLNIPDYVKDSPRAKDYWKKTVSRMRGIALLDDVDTDTLGGYCCSLALRDALRKEADECQFADDRQGIIKTLQAQERLVIAYADKLGLTPAARVRLAKTRAQEREVEPDADLFD